MDWTNQRRREALAADYVLGLLQGPARVRFERRMRDDPALERRVWGLRARLDPLLQAEPHQLPADLWRRIGDDLGWSRRTRRWSLVDRLSMGTAIASLVAAIGLGVYVQTRPPIQPGRALAVLHNAGDRHVLRVSLAGGRRTVTVVPLRHLTVPPGHSLELWALPRHGRPVAVGLVRPKAGLAQRYVLRVPVADLGAFAVSIEPLGGSPRAGPTGPVVYQGTVMHAVAPNAERRSG